MVNRVKALKFDTTHGLVKYYNSHKGLSLSEINKSVQEKFGIQITTNKGVVGQILEALVGNVPNSNPNADIAKLKATSKKLSQSIRNDLLNQLANALQQRYPVTINTAAINELF